MHDCRPATGGGLGQVPNARQGLPLTPLTTEECSRPLPAQSKYSVPCIHLLGGASLVYLPKWVQIPDG